MRFQLLDILPNVQNPVTGRLVSTADRLERAGTSARQAEQLGFDAAITCSIEPLATRLPLKHSEIY